jgi:hypothetical protein
MALVNIDASRVLWEVRQLVPNRALKPTEDLSIAELQAHRLLELLGIVRPPVSLTEITARVDVRVTIDHATSVLIPSEPEWEAEGWHITVAYLNNRRTRAVVAHQLKHILDDQFGSRLYPPTKRLTTADRRDRAAAHFASCLLMPRDWVEKAWQDGRHAVDAIAKRFDSPEAMVRLRLVTLGLARPEGPVPGRRGSGKM